MAGVVYFLAVYVAGFTMGVIRVLLVAPRLGATAAVLVELPVMLTASWFACRIIVDRLHVASRASARLVMGASAFALLMLVETALGLAAFGQTPAAQIAALGEMAGLIGLAGQVMFALLPLFQLQRPLRTW
ncbi:MAG: hypothetical protein ABI450_02510 [Rhizomicrobium sp.]